MWGQCSQSLCEHLKSHQNTQAASQDGIDLLVLIKSLVHTFKERRKFSDAFTNVASFYKFYQG